jgi:hypothetical protein
MGPEVPDEQSGVVWEEELWRHGWLPVYHVVTVHPYCNIIFFLWHRGPLGSACSPVL